MFTKSLTIEAMDEAGKGLARIATLSAVDHDGDTYEKGAFAHAGDQWVPLLVAHDRWGMPFGKARVYEEGDAALAELHLNLNTQAGKDWHAALRFDIDTGKSVQEWSYGYEVLDADYQVRGDDRVRVLRKLKLDEVSTVVRGAGQGTGTLAIKGRNGQLKQAKFDELIGGLGELAGALKADPALISATGRKQLDEIHAGLGAALAVPIELSDDERKAIDSALGADLMRLTARHLPRGH